MKTTSFDPCTFCGKPTRHVARFERANGPGFDFRPRCGGCRDKAPDARAAPEFEFPTRVGALMAAVAVAGD